MEWKEEGKEGRGRYRDSIAYHGVRSKPAAIVLPSSSFLRLHVTKLLGYSIL